MSLRLVRVNRSLLFPNNDESMPVRARKDWWTCYRQALLVRRKRRWINWPHCFHDTILSSCIVSIHLLCERWCLMQASHDSIYEKRRNRYVRLAIILWFSLREQGGWANDRYSMRDRRFEGTSTPAMIKLVCIFMYR